ncbi:heme ABC transporter ATP-binding protein [Stutzerimonas urumqiensis]|uniref:heme ABC transporter ATP-binding protein n=1 Tax=Stutzerimonas urumqiensis TaxID=638269 RepID=UPI003BAD5A9B
MLTALGLTVMRGARRALDDVELAVQPGQVLAVLGPNGAGKSTLIDALVGELVPSAGEVTLHGQPLPRWPGEARAQRLAVLPQRSTLEFAFRVDEIVAMGRLPHASGRSADAQAIEQALAQADVTHLGARNYLSLSGGERQRVQLARVLAQLWPASADRVLLLDEPTAALDPLHQIAVLEAVKQLATAGAAVLMVLHDLSLAARFADRLLLLDKGRVACVGEPEAVLRSSTLSDVFGLALSVERHPERDHLLVFPR